MNRNNSYHILTIGVSATLFICIIGLVIIYLFPKYFNYNLQTGFLSLAGTSLGTLLGQYSKHKKNISITKNIFFRVIFICFSCIGLSIVIFLLLHERGFFSILILNAIGLGISIKILAKRIEH